MNVRAALAAAWLTAAAASAAAAVLPPGPPSDQDTAQAYRAVQSGFFDLEENLPAEPAVVELGRELFFDPRLSSQGTLSCAGCHNPGLSWTDAQPRALGLRRRPLDRNTPSLLNVRRNLSRDFRWDGSAPLLTDAIRNALTSRIEMRGEPRAVLAAILRLPGYARLFDQAYGPGGASLDHAVRAMAVYVHEETSRPVGPSAFDRYAGDPSALGARERKGLVIFAGPGKCMLCHAGTFMSDDYYHNTGLAADPRSADAGRYAVEASANFWRAFKTPPLRGVEWSAPYMHDGRFRTLREVVEFYARGGDDLQARDHLIGRLDLSEEEKEDVVAFLRSLSPPRREVVPPVLPAVEEPATAAAARARVGAEVVRVSAYAKAGDWTGVAAQAQVLAEDLPLLTRVCADEGASLDAGAVAALARAAEVLARVDSSAAPAAGAAGPLKELGVAWTRAARAP